MRRKYRFNDISVKIGPCDPVNPELHLFNVTWPFIVTLGAFRVICSNGLVIGEKYLYLRRRHVYDLTKADLKNQIVTAFNHFKSQSNQWIKWTERRLTKETYDKIVKDMKFGKKAIAEIESRTAIESKGVDDNGLPIITLWIFFNVLTWYITHRAVSLNHRVKLERRLRIASRHFYRTR